MLIKSEIFYKYFNPAHYLFPSDFFFIPVSKFYFPAGEKKNPFEALTKNGTEPDVQKKNESEQLNETARGQKYIF